jgi:hypothetical protein
MKIGLRVCAQISQRRAQDAVNYLAGNFGIARSNSGHGLTYQLNHPASPRFFAANGTDIAHRVHKPHHAFRVARLKTAHPIQSRNSIVLLDFNVAVDVLYTFGLASNGHGLVRRFLASGAATEPHDSVFVGIDVNMPQASDMCRS